MKIKQSLYQKDMTHYQAMKLMTDAIELQPDEAYYYGLLGYYAYSHALTERDEMEKSRLLAVSTAAYQSCIRLEPYLAYWRITLADNCLFRARHGTPDGVDYALNSYREADALFPQNSVILNKLALALMQNGDYPGADRLLMQSEKSDGNWVQTKYMMGLLDAYRQLYSTAEGYFISPIRKDMANVNPFLGFCKHLSLFGGIDRVSESLLVYTSYYPGDWLGFTLLGISDVYGNNIKDGKAAFLNAAVRADRSNTMLLSKIVAVMAEENTDFESAAVEIQARLAALVAE
jgi:tetratricopeptide (TPR) repeat protein